MIETVNIYKFNMFIIISSRKLNHFHTHNRPFKKVKYNFNSICLKKIKTKENKRKLFKKKK